MTRLLMSLAPGLLLGCSLLSDFGDECSSDAQCGDGLRCVEKLCVRVTGEPADRGTNDSGSMDMGTPGDGGVAPDMGAGGLQLDPDLCHTLYGVDLADVADERTILLGMLMPRTGDLGAVGQSIELAAVLALDQINEIGGLQGRRFGIIACDTAADEEQAIEAANWLITHANVPAIIGPAASNVTIRVFNDVAGPNGVLLISPSSTAPAISTLEDPMDLLWRTAPSDALQGAAMAAYLLDREFQKVAVINRDNTYGNGFVAEIRGPLCAADACGEERLFNRRYPEGAGAAEFTPIVADLLRFAPEVVVLIAFVDDGIAFLNTAGQFDLNRFVLTDGARDLKLVDEVNSNAIIDGIIGTAPASPGGQNFMDFTFNYTGAWGVDPSVFNAHSYDAMYLLGYAIAGIPDDAPISGIAIGEQLRRLSAGETVEVGTAAWNDTVSQLAANPEATINFNGASGPVDFDARGEALSDIEGWRIDRVERRIRSLGVIYTADGTFQPIQEPPPPPEPDAGPPDAGPDAAR